MDTGAGGCATSPNAVDRVSFHTVRSAYVEFEKKLHFLHPRNTSPGTVVQTTRTTPRISEGPLFGRQPPPRHRLSSHRPDHVHLRCQARSPECLLSPSDDETLKKFSRLASTNPSRERGDTCAGDDTGPQLSHMELTADLSQQCNLQPHSGVTGVGGLAGGPHTHRNCTLARSKLHTVFAETDGAIRQRCTNHGRRSNQCTRSRGNSFTYNPCASLRPPRTQYTVGSVRRPFRVTRLHWARPHRTSAFSTKSQARSCSSETAHWASAKGTVARSGSD